MSIYQKLKVGTIINAKGPATRLSGGLMRPEVAAAMVEASRGCVDMAELQAAASREIAKATGAEAGFVASGASACLLLGTAACIAGPDPALMAKLPDTEGMKNEVIMARSQRNFYDHAIRAAGARIVEVGLPDRYAGAGVRDAEVWEIEAAITPRTAAIFHVADSNAQPPLREVAELARRHRIPVLVDAAAQLPPQANLKRFIMEGADLVAFSGGKAIGGPQASGFLCGKREFIMSAALQNLDLDIYSDMWNPPRALIDRRRLKGLPLHGIGRSCKVGKEEVIGLLTALRLFTAEGDAARHKRWLAILKDILAHARPAPDANLAIEGAGDKAAVPLLVVTCTRRPGTAHRVIQALIESTPSIHVDPALRGQNKIVINPMCLAPGAAPIIGKALARTLGRAG